MSKPLIRKIESAFAAKFETALTLYSYSVPVYQGTNDGSLEAPFVRVICDDAQSTVDGLTQHKATMRVHIHSHTLDEHDGISSVLENLLLTPATIISAINADATEDLFVYSVFPASQNQQQTGQEWIWESVWTVTADHNQVA